MKKRRLIPLLLLNNGFLVQSRQFKNFQILGNALSSVKRFSEWAADELIYLDISRSNSYDIKRDDLNTKNAKSFLEIIKEVSKVSLMPITAGGKIKSIKNIYDLLKCGADKVVVNTILVENKKFLQLSSREFGSQCIVASVDVKKINNEYIVHSQNGELNTKIKLKDHLKYCQDSGAGEIFLNSIDRDGSGAGYDIDLFNLASNIIKIPIIACGGAGSYDHILELAKKTNVDGISAANFFQHIDQSLYLAKKRLYQSRENFRKPEILSF